MKGSFRSREYTVTIALLLAVLATVFFPIVFRARTLLPTDLIDTMTLPFSNYFGPRSAYNSLITDGYLQFYPLKYFTKIAYEHGHLAFWNPFILNGYPQYLEGMWTYNILLFLPFALAFRLVLLLPLLIGGLGMYSLLREYQVRPGVSRIFATAYMLNALFLTQLLAHFLPASFSFAPWIIFFLHKYLREGRDHFLAFSSLALSLGFLSGNLQTIGFLSILVSSYWISLWLIHHPRNWRMLVEPLAFVLGFGVALAAIMILPTLELFRETAEHGAFFSTSLLQSYTIFQRVESLGLALTFFVPQLAGSIRGVTLDQIVGVYGQDFQGSIGFLPLLLAVWGAARVWRSKPDIRPFAVLMVAGVALPICTPLFHLLYHRFFAVFVFGACGTGAIALNTILTESNIWSDSIIKWVRGFSLALAAIVFLLILTWLLRAFDSKGIEEVARTQLLPRLRHIVFAEGNPTWIMARYREALDYWSIGRPEFIIGIGTSLIALALIAWRNRVGPNAFLLGVWLLTTLQLGYFAYLWFPANRDTQYPLYPKTPETALLERLAKDSRVYCYREVDSARQFIFMDNQNVLYNISEATGYESMTPRSLYIYTAVLHWQDTGLVSPELLGKFNVGTLVRVKPILFDSLTCLASGPLWIYKNPYVFPRAYLAHRAAATSSDSETLSRINDASFGWPKAYFTGNQHAVLFSDSAYADDLVGIQNSEIDSLALTTFSRDSAYLLLTDTYYPGWQATIDGRSTPIVRANYSMRAVLLPPGNHTIVMRFDPLSFKIGKWISLGSLLLLLVIMIRSLRKIKIGRADNNVAHLATDPE